MTVDIVVRRSSRRSIVVNEDKKEESPCVSKRQYSKKEGKGKKNVVNVIQEQEMKIETPKPKMFQINVYKLQESKGDYSKDDIAKTVSSLPRPLDAAGLLPVKFKRKLDMKNCHLEQFVKPSNCINAVKKLKDIGNPFYQGIKIDEDFYQPPM